MRKFLFTIVLVTIWIVCIAAQNGDLSALVTLHVDDAKLSHVLASLGEQSGFNIVSSHEIQKEDSKGSYSSSDFGYTQMEDKGKTMSVHVTNVPVEEAINLIVRAAGYSYEIVGNSILVAPSEDLAAEVGLEVFIVELKYISCLDAMQVLSGFIKEVDEVEALTDQIMTQFLAKTIIGADGSFMSMDPDRNTLVIVASPETIKQLKQVLAEIDRSSYQIVLETRIIEVSINDAEEYGIDWSRINKLTTIIAENATDANGVGIPWGGGSVEPYSNGSTRNMLPGTMPFQKIDGFDNIGHFSRQLTTFDITIDWLLNNNCAKVLTDTRLTTMNNRSASIHIGEVVPYAVTTSDQISINQVSAGMEVSITPIINQDGYITTKIEPKLSSVMELIGGTVPRTMERTASTTVLVKDGEKITIAGLLNSETVKTEDKVPLFSEIPFIGDFFIHTNERVRKTDLVIEITPHIIDPNKGYADDVVLDEEMEGRLLNNDENDLGEE